MINHLTPPRAGFGHHIYEQDSRAGENWTDFPRRVWINPAGEAGQLVGAEGFRSQPTDSPFAYNATRALFEQRRPKGLCKPSAGEEKSPDRLGTSLQPVGVGGFVYRNAYFWCLRSKGCRLRLMFDFAAVLSFVPYTSPFFSACLCSNILFALRLNLVRFSAANVAASGSKGMIGHVTQANRYD